MVAPSKKEFAKLVRRNATLFGFVERVKLWVSRTGVLHGVQSVAVQGEWIEIETHCGEHFRVRDSRHGRGKRKLKHGQYRRVCSKCRVPDWKLEKFSKTTGR